MTGRMGATVLDAAIAWQLRQGSDDFGAADEAEFQRWLAASPEHRQVWQRLAAIDDELAPARSQAARAALVQAPRPGRGGRLAGSMLALVLALGLAAGALDRSLPLRHLLADHHTRTGERRTVVLPDRSIVQLNTRSAIDVAFDDGRRAVHLREGEIAVETAHPDGEARPFVVLTPDGALRAVGTRFLVRRLEQGQGTLLTVTRSAVAARPAHCGEACDGERVIGEGRQAVVSEDGVAAPGAAVADADAWTDGMLVVENARLADVVEELARHRPGFLSVEAEAADLRVSGTFPLADTDLALAALAGSLPVRIAHRTALWAHIEMRHP